MISHYEVFVTFQIARLKSAVSDYKYLVVSRPSWSVHRSCNESTPRKRSFHTVVAMAQTPLVRFNVESFDRKLNQRRLSPLDTR